jgi:hypothetical protein
MTAPGMPRGGKWFFSQKVDKSGSSGLMRNKDTSSYEMPKNPCREEIVLIMNDHVNPVEKRIL